VEKKEKLERVSKANHTKKKKKETKNRTYRERKKFPGKTKRGSCEKKDGEGIEDKTSGVKHLTTG